MQEVKLGNRRRTKKDRSTIPFETLLKRLEADTGKHFNTLRMLLEACYTAGYLDSASAILEAGDNLSGGWQSLTGGATWQEISEVIEELEVPVPEEFVRFLNGEPLETIFNDLTAQEVKDVFDFNS